MNSVQLVRRVARSVVVAAVAGSVVAVTPCIVAAEAQSTTEPDMTAEPELANAVAERGDGKSWWQQRQDRRKGRPEAYRERLRARQTEAAQNDTVPQKPKVLAANELSEINVSFRLDRRLTAGLYMGDRWVSPPTYSGVQDGVFVVDARAQGRDTKGQPGSIDPDWTATDPGMVTVSPARGKEATITVHRAGQSRVRITVPAESEELTVSTELSIDASYQGTTLRVAITPQATTRPAGQDASSLTLRNGWKYVSGDEEVRGQRRTSGKGWKIVDGNPPGAKPGDSQDSASKARE
jgi:hypothetical protein